MFFQESWFTLWHNLDCNLVCLCVVLYSALLKHYLSAQHLTRYIQEPFIQSHRIIQIGRALGKHLIKILTQSKANYQIRPGYSGYSSYSLWSCNILLKIIFTFQKSSDTGSNYVFKPRFSRLLKEFGCLSGHLWILWFFSFIAQYPIIESQGFYSNQIEGESGLKVKIITVLYKYPVLKRSSLIIYKQQLWFFSI